MYVNVVDNDVVMVVAIVPRQRLLSAFLVGGDESGWHHRVAEVGSDLSTRACSGHSEVRCKSVGLLSARAATQLLAPVLLGLVLRDEGVVVLADYEQLLAGTYFCAWPTQEVFLRGVVSVQICDSIGLNSLFVYGSSRCGFLLVEFFKVKKWWFGTALCPFWHYKRKFFEFLLILLVSVFAVDQLNLLLLFITFWLV